MGEGHRHYGEHRVSAARPCGHGGCLVFSVPILPTHHACIFGLLQEEANLVGFEAPGSPDSTYDNPVPGDGDEDEARAPPSVPPQLQRSLLGAAAGYARGALPPPPSAVLNHLYIENGGSPRSVVALCITHRFHSKYVRVVLYKPVGRRGA